MARYEPRRSDTFGRKRPSVVTFSHTGKREASHILRKTRIRSLSRRLKQHFKYRQLNNHLSGVLALVADVSVAYEQDAVHRRPSFKNSRWRYAKVFAR